MSDELLWIVLIGAVVNILLLTMFVIRRLKTSDGLAKPVRDELRMAREENRKSARELREELSGNLKSTSDTLFATLDRIRNTLDSRVKELQEGNEKKLDEMRKVVDAKLHDTLEKRLGESFKLVSDRLESVHKGLGEMQALAAGVGDLKRVLTNIKVRGTWAEVQLGAILDEVLTPEQYEKNVRPKAESSEIVEYAIRLPGPKNDPNSCVWLPIDSKFPQEDYLRIQHAAEEADPDAIKKATDALVRSIKSAGKDIHDKYLDPPRTTYFGIMFLATEGLYAEVLRQPSVIHELQERYQVLVAGPTTLLAIISSLRLGFQTLAIEQRAVEVWKVLAAVKTEFGRFGDALDKVKRHLHTVSRTIEETEVRSRAMERKLRSVEQLPEVDATGILELSVATKEPDPDATTELEAIAADDEDIRS